jgi:hypothetical protein
MENEQTNSQGAEPELYPLDETTIALMAEINTEMAKLSSRAEGALLLFLRQHKLQGNWRMAANGRELMKAPSPMSMPSNM